ncbi:MAG TPA: redoxin domain-containing protein, partial [Gemmatimonadaceae bacterium]|nr:redoxin domain-containing protein [Gemmatimonadaceae bacterium]
MWPAARHPGLDELSDFLAGSAADSRARVAAHLEGCQTCRESLQFLRSASAAAEAMPTGELSPMLRARVLASRQAGQRVILPTADTTLLPRRWLLPVAAAILLVLVAGAIVARHPREVEAGTTSGTLTFTPAAPQAGEHVRVRYQPAAMLSGQRSVTLRARLRSENGESYNQGIPTVTVAVLRRAAPGARGTFAGEFTLPDTVVYGAFAVEDSSASVVDDNASRAWEILVSDAAAKPRFEALDQRAKDMMGRNWEEGFATAKSMVTLYPNDLRGWTWLHSFHSWLGSADDDSIRALHRARFAAFDSGFTHETVPTSADKGLMAWYGQGIDSSAAARWRERLLREAPTNAFAIQWRLMDVLDALRTDKDTALALRRLDTLWTEAPPDRLTQVADYATSIAIKTGDTTVIRRWTTRLQQSAHDGRNSSRWVATRFAQLSTLRGEGIRRLRAELDTLAMLSPSDRALDETVARQRARHAATGRRMLAALGQALVAAGQYSAAREALVEASATGWSLDVFRAVQAASLAAGDTTRALSIAARLTVDPRTPQAAVDSLSRAGERRFGVAGWRLRVDSARVEFVERMLADASVRSLPSGTRVRDLNNRPRELRDLSRGQTMVVVFWSRTCGPAIEALPRVNAIAARLARDGVRVVGIVDETSASLELKAFLTDKQVTVPTYLDAWHEASRAFNQWGTPNFYVLDADGRVRFDVTTSADEA